MKAYSLPLLTLVATVCLANPARAENLQDLQRLMSSRQCQNCDLQGAGLVFANLSQVDLSGTNLSSANLSRVNFTNANLTQANLTGAVLFNANLSGADLRGADLRYADLRDTILLGANLEGANLEGANLLGAIGLPNEIATPENLYAWGLAEAQRGNFNGAIDHYNRAIALQPDFANAHLARGISRFRLQDWEGALVDAKAAEQFYVSQNNPQGRQMAVQLAEGIQALQTEDARGPRGGGGNFLGFLGSLGSLLLRFLF